MQYDRELRKVERGKIIICMVATGCSADRKFENAQKVGSFCFFVFSFGGRRGPAVGGVPMILRSSHLCYYIVQLV